MRGLVLLTHIEAVSDLEELARGTIAKEILAGIKMPLWDYQVDDYSGGSLVVGILTAPFFLLIGPHLIALKLTPLLFAASTLIATFYWVNRWWRKEAALWTAAFLTFAPPAFFRLSFVAMGFHTESLFWIALILLFFYPFQTSGFRNKTSAFLFGLFSGLGFSFCYMTAIAFLGCLGSVFVSRREAGSFKRLVISTGAGFGLGALPFIGYNLTHHLRGIKFLVLSFIPSSGSPPFSKLSSLAVRYLQLILQGLPASFGFENAGPWAGIFLSRFYLFGLLILLISGMIWKKAFPVLSAGRREFPLWASLFIFLTLYAFSNFTFEQGSYIDSRYFVIFHYFALILLGIAAAGSWWRRGVAIMLIALGLFGQTRLLFAEPWGRGKDYQGYSYYQLGWIWQPLLRTAQGRKKMAQVLPRFPHSERIFLEGGLAYGLPSQKEWEEISSVFLPETRVYLEEALGHETGVRLREPLETPAVLPRSERLYEFGLANALYAKNPEWLNQNLFSYKKIFKDPDIFYFVLGGLLYDRIREGGDIHQYLRGIEISREPARSWILRGIGKEVGAAWVYDRLPLEKALKRARVLPSMDSPASEKELYWGIGWGIRRELIEDRRRALDWIRRLPERYQNSAREGFETCEKWFQLL